MTNFLQPGRDGDAIPDGNQWVRGVVFTKRSPTLLEHGHEYRITAALKRRYGSNSVAGGFGEVYSRVTDIAASRVATLGCADPGHRPQSRIVCHGWRPLGDGIDLRTAFVMVGVRCSVDPAADGESPPGPDALLSAGGASLEQLASLPPQRADEVFNEFDFGGDGDSKTPVIVSYGESAAGCDALDFEPFVLRAEEFARFYLRDGSNPLKILGRDWFCISDSNVVTVQILCSTVG